MSVSAAAVLAGCANPGPPRAPSLQLPAVVTDLSATRRGDVVELRFTLPQRTTDDVALRSGTVTAKLCRAVEGGPCRPVPATPQTFPITPDGPPQTAELRDTLPPELVSGAPHLLAYRVELLNLRGRTGGASAPAYTASGPGPRPVQDLRAQGWRLGIVLTWTPDSAASGHLVLRREDLDAQKQTAPRKPAEAGATSPTHKNVSLGTAPRRTEVSSVVWLNAAGESAEANAIDKGSTLDTTAAAERPYRYTAERRRIVKLGGQSIELHSTTSPQVKFTLHDVYPPPSPRELTAAPFTNSATPSSPAKFAVDLVWQPVDDPHLAGYNIYRQALNADGTSVGPKTRLDQAPVPVPAFHDATVVESQRYRYSVTAVDTKGNESGAATVMITPASQ